MAKILGMIISMLAGIAVLSIDAWNRVQCELQCLAVPSSDAMRWAGAALIIGPWILLAVYMRCKESLR